MIDHRHFYINGCWVAPRQACDRAVTNPSSEAVIATISLGGQADVDAAVAAARGAFPAWAATAKEDRLAALRRLNEAYKSGSEAMAQAISEEMGAPIALARTAQIGAGAGHLKETIRVLESFQFDRPIDRAPAEHILMEPIGVCALITPWNWPMNQIMIKVAPALAAGCTVILKPSELSPLSALLLAEMIDHADFPAGVFNLVNGTGAEVGHQLTVHPDVDMISFTGSTRAGIEISKAAADTIKRVSLELGGKGANIIFADADDKAITRGVRHCFNNSGQSCNAPTRMLVERSIYDQAVAAAAVLAEKTEVDAAHIEGRHIGPVVSEVQYDKIQTLIRKGIDEGARIVAGGPGRPEGQQQGWFVRPTVFADVGADMAIWREEIFGPVLSMMPFDGEEEAYALANDSRYGLTNYVQTQDQARAQRAARALRSGMVEINGQRLGASAPFGGYKQSGNSREGSVWGIEDFLEVKSIGGWG